MSSFILHSLSILTMWYLILSRREASIDAVKARTADHFVWMKARHAAGDVIISGPTPDRKMGIYVIRADSAESAAQIADSDPFHLHGLRCYELVEWEVHQMLGIGPFSLPGVQFLAKEDADGAYTDLPKE